MYSRKGFTLVELLVVVSIISLLSSIVLASLNTARAKAREVRRQQDIAQARIAVVSLFNDTGDFPQVSDWSCLRDTSPCGDGSARMNASFSNNLKTYLKSLPKDPLVAQRSGQWCSDYYYHSAWRANMVGGSLIVDDGIARPVLHWATESTNPNSCAPGAAWYNGCGGGTACVLYLK